MGVSLAEGNASTVDSSEGSSAQAAVDPSHPQADANRPAPSEIVGKGDDPIASAIARGDRQLALSLCIREHGPSIGRLCMSLLGDQAEADDLTQETLVAAHGAWDSWRGEGSVRAWLLGIARRRCATYLERRTRRQRRLELVEEASHPLGAEEHLARARRARAAREALGQLRPSEREVVLLRFGAELSFREVAAVFGIDEAAARKRASRALAQLRRHVAAEE